MPRKVRQLIADLLKAGFHLEQGKGSHRKFTHPALKRFVNLSGKTGDDAQRYQEQEVKEALRIIRHENE